MNLPILDSAEALRRLASKTHKLQESYLAMYSTWLDGITKEAPLMLVPVDDHLVHRGDGVFEAIKVVQGRAFLLEPHLDRLVSSAEKIFLPLPKTRAEIREIILQTTKLTGVSDVLLRLYISRGPGGFTTNPYDSVGSQMYLIVTSLKSPAAEKYEKGIQIGKSKVPVKDSWLAQIKTCNYLPNVLMKKESVDRALEFTVGFDAQGFLTESSTENIVIVDQRGKLVRPKLRQILKGTTMMRAFSLAEALLQDGTITGIEERDISEAEVFAAKELMMIGTTLDVLPVISYENQNVGSGQVGPVAKKLLALLREDMKKGPFSTPVFD
ncbi:aminotransferase class IV [Bdellovibrio sp. HCB2-146]|uniref:aminotransferase class IV n=1 Tax=Bdellovibrio sp. HCB2-146 TaxID=3394362 RepID=UPI0039BCA616